MPFNLPNPNDPFFGRAMGTPISAIPKIEWHNPDAAPINAALFDIPKNPESYDVTYTPPPTARPPLTADQLASRDALHAAWHRPLTNRQRKFVSALFANGFDTVKAMQETDPQMPIFKARQLGKIWYELPAIKQAIERAFAYYQENTRVRFEDIVAELRLIAFSNVMDFHSVDGKGDPRLEMPADGDPKFAAISEINVEDTKFGTKTRLKLHDKLGAIDKLIKLCKFGDEDRVAAAAVQNIIIMPVPQGTYLPPPTYNSAPLIDLAPVKQAQALLKDARLS